MYKINNLLRKIMYICLDYRWCRYMCVVHSVNRGEKILILTIK